MGQLKKIEETVQSASGGGKLVRTKAGAGAQSASQPFRDSGVNAAQKHSGINRDAFDARVRKNYAAAQKTAAPVLGGTENAEKAAAGSNRITERTPGFSGRRGAPEEKNTRESHLSVGKYLGGIALKGVDTAMSGLTSTADWLVGNSIQEAGGLLGQDWSNNPVSALNKRVQKAKKTNENYFAANEEAGGAGAVKAAELGTSVVAAVPQALLAIATAGGSAAEQGLQSAASAAPGFLASAKAGIEATAKDPQFWLSFLQIGRAHV